MAPKLDQKKPTIELATGQRKPTFHAEAANSPAAFSLLRLLFLYDSAVLDEE